MKIEKYSFGKYKDLIIIEDSHELWGRKIHPLEACQYTYPSDIQSAEEFEDRLRRQKKPYVLVQCETSMPSITDKNSTSIRRGYVLFVEKDDNKGEIK